MTPVYLRDAESLMAAAMANVRSAVQPIHIAFDAATAAPAIDRDACRKHLSEAISRLQAAHALLGDATADDAQVDHRKDFDTPTLRQQANSFDSAMARDSATSIDIDALFGANRHPHRNHERNAPTANLDELFA